MIFRVLKSHFVVCCQCFFVFWSREGLYLSKTIICPRCGVENVR